MTERRKLERGDVVALSPHTQIHEVDGLLVAVGPAGVIAIEGVDPVGLRATLGEVDGQRTIAAIAARLAGDYLEADVFALLDELEGVLVERVPRAIGPEIVATRARVAVVGSGALAGAIALELAARGVAVDAIEQLERAAVDELDLVIGAPEGVRAGVLLDLVATAAYAGLPVLFTTIDGDSGVVGPLYVPDRSPCFGCAELSGKLAAAFDDVGPRVLPLVTVGVVAPAAPAWWLGRVAHETASEALRALAGEPYPERIGSRLVVSPEGRTRVSSVAAVTTCPACRAGIAGEVSCAASSRPPALAPRAPAIAVDRTGGTRTVRPEVALERAARGLAAIGVELRHVPVDRDVPAALATACPFFAPTATVRFSREVPLVFPDHRAGCFGKGTTDVQARCSATFEWIERNLSTWRGGRELVRASWNEVRACAIDVPHQASGLLPGASLPGRRPFDPGATIDWVWGRRLDVDEPMLVPASSVFFGETRFVGSDLELPRAGSSGLSAGCSLAEAILQGLLEIVERDATYTALRNGMVHPSVPLASIDAVDARSLVERVTAAGYALRVRDITSAIGVPTFEAYVVGETELRNHFAAGYGAHLDPAIALRRALTEALQSLFACASAHVLRSEASLFEVFPHRMLAMRRTGGAPRVHDARFAAETDVWAHVDEVVARVRRALPRSDVGFVDLSSEELPGIHVVRAIVTGAFDEARPAQLHVPERCRLVPLDEMYLGKLAM